MNKKNKYEPYEVLSEHFFRSENYAKASEYLYLSSKKALKSASPYEAITHSQKMVSAIEKLPRSPEQQDKLINGRTRLGLIFLQLNLHSEAKEAVDPILTLALEKRYYKYLPKIYSITGTYYAFVEEDFSHGISDLEKGLKISEELNDLFSFGWTNFWLGTVYSLKCDFIKSLYTLTKALELNELGKISYAISVTNSNISYFVYFLQGNMKKAYQKSSESVQVAEKVGDIYSKAIAYTSQGCSYYGLGLFEKSKNYLYKGIEHSERSSHLFWNTLAYNVLGRLYYVLGDFQNSRTHFKESTQLAEKNKIVSSWINFNKIGLIRSMIMNNEKDIILEPLYSYYKKNKSNLFEGWIPRYIGEILLNIDDNHIAEAKDWIEKAIEEDIKNGMNWNLARDYTLYAELFKRKGDLSKVKEILGKATLTFKQCGADGWVEKYEKELGEL